MEEALYDMALFREFVGLDAGEDNLPDESTILPFRHLLESNNLSLQILATVNATLIAAPSSTKNSSGERDPEMHLTKKGNQWHFGMKAYRDFPRSQWRWHADSLDDSFLSPDTTYVAWNEEQTAHLQPGLLHFVRPQIPTAQQGSIHITWHPVDPPAFIRADLLPV